MSGAAFMSAAVNAETAQDELDTKLEELGQALEQNDVMEALEWVCDYATLASRISDPDAVNMHFDAILTQLESHGYGDADVDMGEDQGANAIISNSMGRMRDGLPPTGYERIFADKIKASAPSDGLNL